MGLFKCKACVALEGRIQDLKEENARLFKLMESERAEYKRAIDVLLHEKQMPTVGQGVYETPRSLNPSEMLAFMEEEVPEKK